MTPHHSFGGSALDRYVLDFEVPEGDVGGSVEPAFEAAPVAEPAWAPDPNEWQQTQQAIQELAQIVQPQQQEGPPVPDPFADDYPEQLQAWGQALVAPYQQFQQEQQQQQLHATAMSQLDALAASGGEFDRGMAWARANELVMWQQIPGEQALAQAAKDVREYEQRVGQQFYERQIAQLQTTSGAPRGLPPGPGGSQTISTGGYGLGPNAVTSRMFGRGE